MEIYEDLLSQGYPKGWEDMFTEHIRGIKHTCGIIEKEGIDFTPTSDKVFNSYRALTPEEVKVVIIGQYPHPARGVADGFSFSCSTGDIPASLRNIFKEISSTVPGFVTPPTGSLTGWCKQGIMLLNTSLVTKVGASNYKPEIWMSLVSATIKKLNSVSNKIIWVMWGLNAQKLGKEIKSGIKLQGTHPSPLSAHKGFFGCKHFITINEILVKQGKTPIDWRITT